MHTSFVNCRLCSGGELVDERFVVSEDDGSILQSTGFIGGEIVDLEDAIIAPGFLELHTNGVNGFHFTHFDDDASYARKLDETAKYYATQGVTGFWATIPTVSPDEFQKILPALRPRSFDTGASLLGAHVEGPYLSSSRKGAHNSALFHPPSKQPEAVYGSDNFPSIKLATLAPELPESSHLISNFVDKGIRVSLGHSDATYAQGLDALAAGATCLTHTMNAMAPLHHRQPGLAGLTSLPLDEAKRRSVKQPYFTVIADGHHTHPATVSLLTRASPQRSILITDSIELAGLSDGTYPGHSQIPFPQHKRGTLATVEGTDTMIGGCISLQESVRNLMRWTGSDVAQAVRCVTENVADFMGENERGKLEEGRTADFVIMNDEGEVLQTWIAGKLIWEK